MAGVNKVILVGNLGADPEVRTFQDGGKLANLSLATSRRWRDRQSGEAREHTEWHRITVRGDGLVRVVEQYTRKGSRLYVEGALATRKWQDQSGADRWTTEIVVAGFGGQIVLLDRAEQGSGAGGGSGGSGGGYDTPPQGEIDDEIPF